MRKAQDTGRTRVAGTKNQTQPSLGKGRFGFPFGKITCYSMKRGLVPLTRKGLVPVLKDNITLSSWCEILFAKLNVFKLNVPHQRAEV